MAKNMVIWIMVITVSLIIISMVAKNQQPQPQAITRLISEGGCEQNRLVAMETNPPCITDCTCVDESLRNCLNSCAIPNLETMGTAAYGTFVYYSGGGFACSAPELQDICFYNCIVNSDSTPASCIPNVECLFNSDCVVGEVCNDHHCLAQDECIDSDGGFDYEVVGTATGWVQSTPSSATDYCSDPQTLIEFYCDGPLVGEALKSCPCQGGTCLANCNTYQDTDCDGIVTRNELGVAISKWVVGTISRDELGEAIQAWVVG